MTWAGAEAPAHAAHPDVSKGIILFFRKAVFGGGGVLPAEPVLPQ